MRVLNKVIIFVAISLTLISIGIYFNTTYTVKVHGVNGTLLYERTGIRVINHTSSSLEFINSDGKREMVSGNFIVIEDR